MSDYLKVAWDWDDVDFTSQAGDACALFDTNGDGNINVAVCSEVVNGPGWTLANPIIIQNVAALGSMPYVFSCGDGAPDRCTQHTSRVTNIGGTSAGVLGSENQTGFLNETGNLVTNLDPFPSGNFYPNDTTVQVNINKSWLSTNFPGAVMVNVCSYPSIANGVNNAPSDCIVNPGGGFLVIVKDAGTGVTSPNFNFTVSPAPPSPQPANYAIAGSNQTSPIILAIGSGYNVTEGVVPTGWSLTDASCKKQDGTSTGTRSGNAVTGIAIESGNVTTCTFKNKAPSNTTTLLNTTSITVGGSATDTATVTGSVGTPTGTVQFSYSSDGGVTFTDIGQAVQLVNGQAVLDIPPPTLSPSTTPYYFKANYSGDSNYTGSTSGNLEEPLTVNSPPPTAKIAPTGTTCSDFTSGTAPTLAQLNYSVKAGAIFQVDPGVFFYFTNVTLPAPTNIINVTQSNTLLWKPIEPKINQISLYNSACTKVSETSSLNSTTGTATMSTSVPAGSYVVQIQYDSQSIGGQKVNTPLPTDTYTFQTDINSIFDPSTIASIKVVPK